MAARNRLAEILVQAGVIDDLQLRSALAHMDHWGGRLTKAISDKRFAPDEAVVGALAKALSIEHTPLGSSAHDAAALHKLDAKFCQDKGVYPVALRDSGKTLHVAMADPTDMELQDEIGRRSRTRTTVAVAGEAEIHFAIDRHYYQKEPVLTPMPQRSSKGIALGEEAPGEQFKVTDLSDKTRAGVGDSPSNKQPALPVPPAPETADSILEDLLGGGAPIGLSEEDMARVHALLENQDKASKILQALTELLAEKGLT